MRLAGANDWRSESGLASHAMRARVHDHETVPGNYGVLRSTRTESLASETLPHDIVTST
jgi:hypothetical protein